MGIRIADNGEEAGNGTAENTMILNALANAGKEVKKHRYILVLQCCTRILKLQNIKEYGLIRVQNTVIINILA